MAILTKTLDSFFYPDFPDNWDHIIFREKILSLVNPHMKVLDLGAGSGIIEQFNFKGHVAKVCGVDLDERVLANPYLDETKIGSAETIPYPDESFDLVICCNVMEHLPDPAASFKEVHRVLKAGGLFIIKTPNVYHYVTAVARMTPYWFHTYYNEIRGRAEEDTFPTLYRANSKKRLRRHAEIAGFKVNSIEIIEGRPEYLRMSWFTYLLGIIYERLVNTTKALENFRVVILACLEKY